MMVNSFIKTDGKERDGVIMMDYMPYTNSSSPSKDVIYLPSNSIIANMDALRFPLESDHVKPTSRYEMIYVDTSAADAGPSYHGGYIGAMAFDGVTGGDSCWQTNNGLPQWLKITYPEPRKAKGYVLQTGGIPERMIKSWTLQGSDDDNKWTDIDSRQGQIDWKKHEKRLYELGQPAEYRYYRFFITEGNDPVFLRIDEISIVQ
ncbi:MAG: discoidin domain-containing protein [Deltaproteobacteria bacterium]|nr:discoidin domain-containing protein [Deltaproteobacteria bacterium]